MEHLHEDQLLDLLGTDPIPADAGTHLAECADCRRTVDELRTITGQLKTAPVTLERPDPAVWQRILHEVDEPTERDTTPDTDRGRERDTNPVSESGTDPVSERDTTEGTGEGTAEGTAEGTEPPRRLRSTPSASSTSGRLKWLLAVAAALVLGAVVGRISAGSDDAPRTTVLARAQLDTLTRDQQRLGTASLTRTGDTTSVKVAMDSLPSRGRIVEVWLINKDGKRMVSVGFLDGTGPQTFAIDPRLLDEGYVIVDVSREPLDGNPAHSGDSIVRGTLPV